MGRVRGRVRGAQGGRISAFLYGLRDAVPEYGSSEPLCESAEDDLEGGLQEGDRGVGGGLEGSWRGVGGGLEGG